MEFSFIICSNTVQWSLSIDCLCIHYRPIVLTSVQLEYVSIKSDQLRVNLTFAYCVRRFDRGYDYFTYNLFCSSPLLTAECTLYTLAALFCYVHESVTYVQLRHRIVPSKDETNEIISGLFRDSTTPIFSFTSRSWLSPGIKCVLCRWSPDDLEKRCLWADI
jgi:hypothetical protein